MNRPTDPKDGLNDDDMRALFNSDQSNTPPSLDKAILSAAHKAVSNQEQMRPHVAKRWYSYWPQGFSAAAVVVLTILMVPTIVSTPESSLDSSRAGDEALKSLNEASDELGKTPDAFAQKNAAPELAAKNSVEANSESSLNNRLLLQNKSSVQSTNSRASSRAADDAVVLESASDAQPASTPAAPLSGVASISSNQADAASVSDSADGTGQPIDSQRALVSHLTGSRFQSEKEPSQWITFDGNTFTWQHLNRIFTGTYQFINKEQFTAQLPDRQLTIELSKEGLLWDSERYKAK